MWQTEITIFAILVNIVLLIFIAGIVIFVLQFRQKKMQYEKEKKLADEQHEKDLLNTQLNIQHQTMQHIGSEIHDSVGQKLTLASLYINQINQANRFPELNPKIATIGNLINESLEELRTLSKTLNNPALAQTGLIELLKEEARQINSSGVCQIALHFSGSMPDILPSEKNIIFRILQEFIQNSLKHSGCSLISIHVTNAIHELHITAMDDGKGFDLTVTSEGIGLSNMKRRAQQIGASLSLQSSSTEGTSLNLHLPAKNKNTTSSL